MSCKIRIKKMDRVAGVLRKPAEACDPGKARSPFPYIQLTVA